MVRKWLLPIVVGLVQVSAVAAQSADWRFHWQPGQVLTYKVEHTTVTTDTAGEAKDETKTKLNLTKRWQVLAVDPAGVATVQLSLMALRNEITRPNHEVLLFDSADPKVGTPELREAMAAFIGTPLAVLRVDATGRVVEVKESRQGSLSRFETTPPFVIVLFKGAAQPGQYWQRDYAITVEPPAGTGEKYQATQRYLCKEVKPTAVVLELTTTLKTQPEAVADQLPLLQWLPEGEIVFDPQAGLLRSARLHIDKELKGHQGEGSAYRFQSQYTEEYVGNP
jgi:hypothetical protein